MTNAATNAAPAAAAPIQPTARSRQFARLVVAASLLAMFAPMTGCSTPVYSAKERGQLISRNWNMEWQMAQDDIDNALMLRPMSSLTRWNVR